MSKQTQSFSVNNNVEETYAALKIAVEKLRYTVASADDEAHSLTIKTRVSAFSWGEVITAAVSQGENGGSLVELFSEPKLKTNVVDMGRAKRELSAIADAVVAELSGDANKPQAAQSSATASVADEIRQLAQLKDEGLITEEEFAAKKKQLLGI